MGLLDFLKPDPAKRLLRQIQAKTTEAMHLQRNGKIPQLAQLHAEIARLEEKLKALSSTREG